MARFKKFKGEIYNSSKAKVLIVNDGADLKIQASNSGSFKVVGTLVQGGEPKVLSVVNLNDFSITDTITDSEVYAADVTGFYSISVDEVNGIEKIYATIST